MYRAVKPHPHHLCHATRIVAVGLVDLSLQHRPHVPRLNADHWQARFGERAEQPLRQRSSFQPNPFEVVSGLLQYRQQCLRFARYFHFPNDLARVIHNTDAGLLDRYVQSSKMVHAALLLLMLEAVQTDLVFTISPKRSTQNLHLSTGRSPITPSIRAEWTWPYLLPAQLGREWTHMRHVSSQGVFSILFIAWEPHVLATSSASELPGRRPSVLPAK